MLFNSVEFIWGFLPFVIIIFGLSRYFFGIRVCIALLVLSSFFFYGWWKIEYVFLLSGSIVFNFYLAQYLCKARESYKKITLIVGIIVNLAVIGYYKYFNFFLDSINYTTGNKFEFHEIVLPLAISFFTFQQIAFLVDCRRGLASERKFLNYVLFVTFFPQLIAGPIVHHTEMMPQFKKPDTFRLSLNNLVLGLFIFSIGLFKKAVLADGVAPFANEIFKAAETGALIFIWDAWAGALSYALQIYFDFSGYSDMAIGLALVFGIKLPYNFNSPYKATNIIEFWRRWHMTLSRFMRDYLYIPLGGNQKGDGRRYINLMTTMLIGGFWHGAGWNFIIWGGLHGMFLALNALWLRVKGHWNALFQMGDTVVFKIFGLALTFICVVLSWVFFRAESFSGSSALFGAMFNFNGLTLESFYSLNTAGQKVFSSAIIQTNYFVVILLTMFFIVFCAPNSIRILEYAESLVGRSAIQSKIIFLGGIIYTIFMLSAITLGQESNEFLYFNF